MELQQIETDLQNPDVQYRLRAIAALKDYPSEIAVPFLNRHVQDPDFLVRSVVARELGQQQTSESFAALLHIIKLDNTPNVRATLPIPYRYVAEWRHPIWCKPSSLIITG